MKSETAEDLSALLFLVPFAASAVYAVYLWLQTGVGPVLPSSVYLTVTRDPYLFLTGAVAVMAGAAIAVSGADAQSKTQKVSTISGTLQKLAAASFVFALLAAWYSNGFLDVTGTASDLLVGRYSIIFPALIVLLSYLIVAPVKASSFTERRFLGVFVMLLVPAAVYEVGKRETVLGLAIGAALLALGLWIFTRGSPEAKE